MLFRVGKYKENRGLLKDQIKGGTLHQPGSEDGPLAIMRVKSTLQIFRWAPSLFTVISSIAEASAGQRASPADELCLHPQFLQHVGDNLAMFALDFDAAIFRRAPGT